MNELIYSIDRTCITDEELSRCKVLRVSVYDVLGFLFCQQKLPECITLPDCNLPEGWKLISLHLFHAPTRMAAVIYHPSFEKVEPWKEFPDFLGNNPYACSWKFYQVATPEELASRDKALWSFVGMLPERKGGEARE